MIIANMSGGGNPLLLIVLEPGNLERLKSGKPILKKMGEFLPMAPRGMELMIAYTPDIEWVGEQCKGLDFNFDGLILAQILEASLTREPVIRKSGTEEIKRVMPK
jgi:hypothetical protein